MEGEYEALKQLTLFFNICDYHYEIIFKFSWGFLLSSNEKFEKKLIITKSLPRYILIGKRS